MFNQNYNWVEANKKSSWKEIYFNTFYSSNFSLAQPTQDRKATIVALNLSSHNCQPTELESCSNPMKKHSLFAST